jgi:hypothetical protein
MNYQEYHETELITAMRENLSEVMGEEATRNFLSKVYTKLENSERGVEQKIAWLTKRAKDGLLADMLFWVGLDKGDQPEGEMYWYIIEQILWKRFGGKALY